MNWYGVCQQRRKLQAIVNMPVQGGTTACRTRAKWCYRPYVCSLLKDCGHAGRRESFDFPFDQFKAWMSEAEASEPNVPNAIIEMRAQ